MPTVARHSSGSARSQARGTSANTTTKARDLPSEADPPDIPVRSRRVLAEEDFAIHQYVAPEIATITTETIAATFVTTIATIKDVGRICANAPLPATTIITTMRGDHLRDVATSRAAMTSATESALRLDARTPHPEWASLNSRCTPSTALPRLRQ